MQRSGFTLKISPGKELEFRIAQRGLAASAAVDRLIEATEPAYHPAALDFDRRRVTDKPLSLPPARFKSEEVSDLMWADEYIAEKERKLRLARLDRVQLHERGKWTTRGVPIAGRLAAVVGRRMRRLGEGLESWATPGRRASC